MQLNDLIEEHTIESIAKKTNVAEAVITKLFNQEFKSLKLSQALGALSIIEREYGVDLNELRQECKVYFEDYDSSEGGIVALTPINEERRAIPRFLVFVLLALLAYGAWYFFTGYYKQKILPLDPKGEKSLTNTILHSNDTASRDEKNNTTTKSVSRDDRSEVVAGDDVATDSVNKSIAEQGSESNQSAYEVVSETVIKEEDAETNQSTLSAISETVVEEQKNTAMTAEADEILEVTDTIGQPPVILARETMTLLPQELMWFRLINLDTKKKREFKRKDRYEIDLRENDWLFATENTHFAIIDNDRFEEFSGEGKLFFRLDQEGIHQLSEDEYRAEEK